MHEDRLWVHGDKSTEGEVMRRLCFACDKKLGRNPALVMTDDGRTAFVGSDCIKHVVRGGAQGWLAPNGVRLQRLTGEHTQQELGALRARAVNEKVR
jgi:hypothetical protein